jgi:hypothetical protein
LVDVNMDVAGVVGVLLYMQGDGCEGDGFACPPADALEGEDRVSVVGECLVLGWSRVSLLSCGFGESFSREVAVVAYHDPLPREVFHSDLRWCSHDCVSVGLCVVA